MAEIEGDKVQNIPHMHLFLLLKKQFPELRDADVTDCLQRFGLNKELCEKELTQRINEQQKVYYSPWSPRRPSSRNSDTSPSSSSAMPLTNGDDLSLPSFPPQELEDELLLDTGQRTGDCGSNRSPQSAPIYGSSNPFVYQPPTGRRKSAETPNEPRKLGVLHKLSEHPETEDDDNVNAFSPDRSVSPFTASPADMPTSPPASTPASNAMSSLSQYSETSSRDVDVAVINDQLERKSKLEGELKFRREEQNKLEEEIQTIKDKHEAKENEQKRDIEEFKKRIENLMGENIFLLSDCDTMTQKILEEYEEDPSMPALERRQNSNIPYSADANPASSPFINKIAAGDVDDRRTTPRPRPVLPSGTTNYPQRHQDRNTFTEEVEHDWACCKCTFLNHATLSHCEMCGYGNFPGGASENGSCYCHRRFDYDHVARGPVRNA